MAIKEYYSVSCEFNLVQPVYSNLVRSTVDKLREWDLKYVCEYFKLHTLYYPINCILATEKILLESANMSLWLGL